MTATAPPPPSADGGLRCERLTSDALERLLIEMERAVARLRATQVDVLREVDRRQLPSADGCRTLDEWTASRLDVRPETASDLVRLAREDRLEIGRACTDGDITFDRAAALTKLPVDDPVGAGADWDIAGLGRLIARHRRVTARSEQESFADRYLVLQPSLDRASLRLWGELAGVDAMRVEHVLTERADATPALPDGRREPRRARLADALTTAVLDSSPATTTTATPATVTVFVDASDAIPTSGEAGVTLSTGSRVGPQFLEAVLCDAVTEVTVTDTGEQPVGVGRRTRTLPGRIRRLVWHRDRGMCTIDGCQSRYRLQPHHIRPWSEGGTHGPENLTLLCWFHHHVAIHGHGLQIDPTSPPHRRRFLRAPLPGRGPPG